MKMGSVLSCSEYRRFTHVEERYQLLVEAIHVFVRVVHFHGHYSTIGNDCGNDEVVERWPFRYPHAEATKCVRLGEEEE